MACSNPEVKFVKPNSREGRWLCLESQNNLYSADFPSDIMQGQLFPWKTSGAEQKARDPNFKVPCVYACKFCPFAK